MSPAVLPAVRSETPPSSPIGRVLRSVLTHPVALAVKAPIKDAVWMWRGRGIRNPSPRQPVRSVVFVCQGNICRSPFAALRAEQLLAEAGSAIRCASAGIRTTQAERSPVEACETARRYGVRLDRHVPLQLSASVIASHDAIVVMEAEQYHHLCTSYPEAAGRIWLLSLMDGRRGYARYHVADPFGRPAAAFVACYRRIDNALGPLLDALRKAEP